MVKKIIIIIIDAIALFLIGYSYAIWLNKGSINDSDVYSFRNFNYTIPKNLEYSMINDNSFILENKKYYAIVEAFIDENNTIFKYPNLYYEGIVNNDYKIDKPERINVNGKEVMTFNKHDKENNSIICYFSTTYPFAYEVEFINKDNSFNTDNLGYIMDILLAAEYDNNSKREYEYFDSNNIPGISQE